MEETLERRNRGRKSERRGGLGEAGNGRQKRSGDGDGTVRK